MIPYSRRRGPGNYTFLVKFSNNSAKCTALEMRVRVIHLAVISPLAQLDSALVR